MGFSSCLVDLPNIELFATGSFKNRIELWVLRTRNDTPQVEDSKDQKHKKAKETKKKDEPKKKEKNHLVDNMNNENKKDVKPDPDDDVSKLKKKTLEGHKKAIREIAYSEAYKVLISVGFDF